jgi:hypothetical protein
VICVTSIVVMRWLELGDEMFAIQALIVMWGDTSRLRLYSSEHGMRDLDGNADFAASIA